MVFTLIAVPCFIAGAVVGRWPAIFLALLSVAFVAIASLASPDEDLGLVGAIYLTLVITVPFCGVAIAVGVGARKLAGRLAQGST